MNKEQYLGICKLLEAQNSLLLSILHECKHANFMSTAALKMMRESQRRATETPLPEGAVWQDDSTVTMTRERELA